MPIFLSNYRYALANGCGHTEKCCASTTINLRSVVVKEFYRYLILKDSECSLDSEFERDHELDYFLIKKFVNVASRIRATHKSKKRGRALTEDQINRILNYLPLPHSLIFKWTLATGLRRSNAVDLNLDQLPKNNLSINFIEIKVKGGKLISIPVTSALLDMTMDYIYTKRAILSSRNPRSTNKVFLGRGGFAITSNAYYRAFDRACRRAAIKASPHMARHTFAARAYSVLEKLALDGYPVNPIKLLQSWLGHNQAETTEIYLDSIAALDRPIIDGLLHVQKMAIT
ncbi:tyrosine-type recombinase/integrase [Xanthomonas arboricola]|uniref:tyrosine-type recombinase/integrase n=1 Tax=Xanthomonas arboricola TaxID=56448 RepID=UPI0015E2808F|nr:tyrosine-type recombinase/integrase [Xanthomonas arboricola]